MKPAKLTGTLPALLLAPVLVLSGCWTARNPSVQPPGEARLIQDGIIAEAVKPVAIVEAVDHGARTIVLRTPGAPVATTYPVARGVENFDELRMGERVEPTIRQELSIYVLRDGYAPGADGRPRKIDATAHVWSVDSSYRLLQLQYADGSKETLKLALSASLRQMETGDAVVVRPIEAVRLREKR